MTGAGNAARDDAMREQATFRAVLSAMSRPGTPGEVGDRDDAPAPLQPATAAVALCLFDHETAIWLDPAVSRDSVREFLAFHCGCPVTETPEEADFAVLLADGGTPDLGPFDAGSHAFPDRSATAIVQVPEIGGGTAVSLTGPGIRTAAAMRIAGLSDDFWRRRRDRQAEFPLGIDLIFTAGRRVVALPRSTEIGI